jgi:hypothetical protein
MKAKIVIGYNDLEKYTYDAQSNLKLECLLEAIENFRTECNSDIDDLQTFEAGFYNYALNYIKDKHKAAANLGVQDLEFCRLFGYDFEKLKEIETRYKIQIGSIKIVKNLATIDESLDYNIYCDTEQHLQKLNDVNELIKAVTNIYERYFKGQIGIQQMQFMNRLYTLAPDGTQLIPNHYFIKHE